MNPVEYKVARRIRLRRILVDVAVGVIANLVVASLTVAARLVM